MRSDREAELLRVGGDEPRAGPEPVWVPAVTPRQAALAPPAEVREPTQRASALGWSGFVVPLQRFVASRVHHASDVDDLVQLILERAIVKSESVSEIDHAAGWLFAVARNAIADHHRAQARALLAAAEALDAAPALLGASDEDRAAVIACMEPLLRTLPSDTAQLLRWADMESRPLQSIADALGISLTATLQRSLEMTRVCSRKMTHPC